MRKLNLLIILLAPLFLFVACDGPTYTEPRRPEVKDSITPTENYSQPMQVGSAQLLVEVVNSEPAREQGLSGRTHLADGHGMLFDFTNTAWRRPGFWMKEMNFDIDIIWINNNHVIGITPRIPAPKNPGDNLPTYSPPGDITHVLEVPSGWAERQNIKIGDIVKK